MIVKQNCLITIFSGPSLLKQLEQTAQDSSDFDVFRRNSETQERWWCVTLRGTFDNKLIKGKTQSCDNFNMKTKVNARSLLLNLVYRSEVVLFPLRPVQQRCNKPGCYLLLYFIFNLNDVETDDAWRIISKPGATQVFQHIITFYNKLSMQCSYATQV